jgi:phenylalanyl-tRNA synthetase beta chain
MQPHWTGEAPPFDMRELEGVATNHENELGHHLEPADKATQSGSLPTWADPASAWVVMDGRGDTADPVIRGFAARVVPAAIDSPAWADPVFAFEIDVTQSAQVGASRPAAAAGAVAFKPLPAYPAVERDLALLVPHGLDAAAVLATVQQSAGPLLETAFPFDVYRGKGIDAALRSVALRLRFRAPDRTLTDEEVDRAIGRVLNRLKEDHGIERRA